MLFVITLEDEVKMKSLGALYLRLLNMVLWFIKTTEIFFFFKLTYMYTEVIGCSISCMQYVDMLIINDKTCGTQTIIMMLTKYCVWPTCIYHLLYMYMYSLIMSLEFSLRHFPALSCINLKLLNLNWILCLDWKIQQMVH